MNPDAFRRTPEGYFTSRWGLPEYADWIDESMSWKETYSIGDPGERQIAVRARAAPAPYKQDNWRVDLSALR